MSVLNAYCGPAHECEDIDSCPGTHSYESGDWLLYVLGALIIAGCIVMTVIEETVVL